MEVPISGRLILLKKKMTLPKFKLLTFCFNINIMLNHQSTQKLKLRDYGKFLHQNFNGHQSICYHICKDHNSDGIRSLGNWKAALSMVIVTLFELMTSIDIYISFNILLIISLTCGKAFLYEMNSRLRDTNYTWKVFV